MFPRICWQKVLLASLISVLSCIGLSHAEAPERTIRVGLLLAGFEPTYPEAEREFLAGMRDMGYIEGKNLSVERRYAHLQPERMNASARELAALYLDAVVAGCTNSTRALQRASPSTPIIMASVADPVGQGFVRSLAQSGTNVTGRSSQSRELLPKMIELFHVALPKAEAIAVLVNTANPVHETLWSDAVAAARKLDLELVRAEVRGAADLEAALQNLGTLRVQGLLVLPDDPMALNHRGRIVAHANKLGLPSFFGYREFVDEGGLMSYGERFAESYRYAASYVDKVVRGASPSRLPIEQPTRFEMVINLRTASALGVDVPKALLLRADETIR
ncbi:MAG: ABC transporter substrate-binding protein [Candidatus Methylophosphatis roskildensis]